MSLWFCDKFAFRLVMTNYERRSEKDLFWVPAGGLVLYPPVFHPAVLRKILPFLPEKCDPSKTYLLDEHLPTLCLSWYQFQLSWNLWICISICPPLISSITKPVHFLHLKEKDWICKDRSSCFSSTSPIAMFRGKLPRTQSLLKTLPEAQRTHDPWVDTITGGTL